MIARRYTPSNLPKASANTKGFSARALNKRPYIRDHNCSLNKNLFNCYICLLDVVVKII